MESLSSNGAYSVDESVKTKINSLFYGGYCDDENTLKTIKELYENEDYLSDTHTAVAVNVYRQYVEKTGDKTPTVVASTASPYKFSKSVLAAVSDEKLPDDEFLMVDELSSKTNTEVPAPLSALKEAKVRFNKECNVDEMPGIVLDSLSLS